ncbi:MAG: helix-turn-helix transcriptional regulator [Bacteroidales bacterium]|jgi:regulator of cell morphogenesis and NO signaling
MHNRVLYTAADKMGDLIGSNYPMLFVMSRFGIHPGFGDKTIEQACRLHDVHTPTFLAVVNLLIAGSQTPYNNLSLSCLVKYLHNSHSHFLDIRLPAIRQQLLKILGTPPDTVGKAVLRFYDEYVEQVRTHMAYEEDTVFPYVRSLLEGAQSGPYCIEIFSRQHDNIEAKLSELKNILIKYYPTGNPHELNNVLFDIFACAQDLASHNYVEDHLFVPLITQWEQRESGKRCNERPHRRKHAPGISRTTTDDELSKREKEVLAEVAKGYTNKEIAERLYISVHTVMTHRKNITGKLNIHSLSGLTIYAILNHLVHPDQIKK